MLRNLYFKIKGLFFKKTDDSTTKSRRQFFNIIPGAILATLYSNKSEAATWKKITTPSTATTWTAAQNFAGSASNVAAVLTNAAEVATVASTAATGTVIFYTATQSVMYYTTAASANWTVNLRHSSGTSLNTALAVGQCITVAFLVTQGGTAYYSSAVQVDGVAVTPKWQGGTAPTSGNANSIDVYTYTIIKTAATPTYTVIASLTKFA